MSAQSARVNEIEVLNGFAYLKNRTMRAIDKSAWIHGSQYVVDEEHEEETERALEADEVT
jgi:hypothetical protein